jgi:hypothetical protein
VTFVTALVNPIDEICLLQKNQFVTAAVKVADGQ